VISSDTVLNDVIAILNNLLDDWELEAEIREDSYVLADLGLESIDVVALASAVDAKYQSSLPFAQFISELQSLEQRDFTIGRFVEFVTRALNEVPLRAPRSVLRVEVAD
jgi:acyl carrier protein